MSLKKKIAAAVFPRPILLLERLNWNARASQWLAQNKGLPVYPDRFQLYEDLARQIGEQPIDYLEFGVFRGESFKYWLGLNRKPESRFTGFDTFTGLPEQWENFDIGAFNTDGAPPRINDARGHFIKGIFQDTVYEFLRGFVSRPQLVIHIDSDLFSSALFVLGAMDRVIVPGTIILFDEFASLMHEFRAWNEYLLSFRRSARALGTTPGLIQVAFRIES